MVMQTLAEDTAARDPQQLRHSDLRGSIQSDEIGILVSTVRLPCFRRAKKSF